MKGCTYCKKVEVISLGSRVYSCFYYKRALPSNSKKGLSLHTILLCVATKSVIQTLTHTNLSMR